MKTIVSSKDPRATLIHVDDLASAILLTLAVTAVVCVVGSLTADRVHEWIQRLVSALEEHNRKPFENHDDQGTMQPPPPPSLPSRVVQPQGERMRVISLDFDGVLHPAGDASQPEDRFKWLPILDRLLEQSQDVRLLIHSSWRYEYTDQELRNLLGPLSSRFAGSAPRMPRETAIEYVVQGNKGVIKHLLVLDDEAREFSNGRLELILCGSATGISTPEVQEKIVEWLARTAPSKDTAGR